MAGPFAYDFRKTLMNWSVIVLVALTVVMGFAFLPFLRGAAFQSPIPVQAATSVQYYDNATGYNLVLYTFNQFGDPISGVGVQVTIQTPQQTYDSTLTTNSSGLAHVVIDVPYGGANVNVQVGMAANTLASFDTSLPTPDGTVMALTGNIAPVIDPSNSNEVDASVFYARTGGGPPLGYSIYFAVTSLGQGGPIFGGDFNKTRMTLLGSLDSYHQLFKLPPGTNVTQTDEVSFAIFDSGGAVQTGSFFPGSYFATQEQIAGEQARQAEGLATSFSAGLLGLFVPLIAVLTAYTTYGKDRVTGVLESVLARPISRRGLAWSRYASTVLALGISTAMTLAVLDGVVVYAVGVFLGPTFLVSTFLALWVEAAALVGLMYVFSRMTRSSGSLVALGVGIWILLDFFWGLIVFMLATLAGQGFGSAYYVRIAITANFFNPAQFYSLVATYLTNAFVGGALSFGGGSLIPADYGVTLPSLIATGTLWVVLPFALFLYLAVKKD